MEDIDAVTDFLGSLPAPSKPAAHALRLRPRGELRRMVQSLAKRGYIGCLPFAYPKDSHLVVRVLPEQSPSKCRICVIFSTDAFTIAPTMTHFVAGRLAQIDVSDWDLDEHTCKTVVDYAAMLGSAESTRAVLAARTRATQATEAKAHMGILWAAAGKFDPLFKTLGGAWMYHQKNLARWVRTLRGDARHSHIVDRVSVGYHTLFETGEDVSEPAWRIVSGDHVFDLGYTGIVPGPILGSTEQNALIYAVQFLQKRRTRHKQMDSLLWRAAQAAVDNPRYGGDAHFEAARAIASIDAASAYGVLANAALYASRANKSLVPRILGLALELATAGKWQVLAGTIRLAQTSSRKAI